MMTCGEPISGETRNGVSRSSSRCCEGLAAFHRRAGWDINAHPKARAPGSLGPGLRTGREAHQYVALPAPNYIRRGRIPQIPGGIARAGIKYVEVIPPHVEEFVKNDSLPAARRLLSDLGLTAGERLSLQLCCTARRAARATIGARSQRQGGLQAAGNLGSGT